MLGREKCFEIMERALSYSKSDEMQMLLMGHDHFLTRYANSEIHQNTEEENEVLIVKSIIGKRVGVSSTNDFHYDALKQVVASAEESALYQQDLPEPVRLPKPGKTMEISAYVPRTAEINPEEKALVIQDMISRAHGDRMSLSGAFYTGTDELAVMNTHGVREHFSETRANLAVIASGKETSGYATASARDVDEIDHTRLIEEALESAREYDRTITLEPGEYPVVLEEYAVADMLLYLAGMAFTQEALEEKISFVGPNKDQKMFPDHVSIHDDAFHLETFAMPFDYEGCPKTRVDFIKNGLVTGAVTNNTYHADRLDIASTGHALPPSHGLSSTEPFHLFMEPGDLSEEELLKTMGKGIYVKRFHYLTTVHPLKTLLSGMTRDGVFWVEDGKITARVTNMRFTQSVIDALKHTKALSKKRKFIWFRDFSVDFPISVTVPKLFVEKFNFTGKTEF